MSRRRCRQCVKTSLRRMTQAGHRPPLNRLVGTVWRAVFSEHPVEHSDVVGCCVDVEIRATVEFINQQICPTKWSCQGGNDSVDFPSITVATEDWRTLRSWLLVRRFSISLHYPDESRRIEPPIHDGVKAVNGADLAAWFAAGAGVVHLRFTGLRPVDVFPTNRLGFDPPPGSGYAVR